MSHALRSWRYTMGTDSGRKLRALILPITPRVIFRAILGVILFFCGIIAGAWVIIRSRRHSRKQT